MKSLILAVAIGLSSPASLVAPPAASAATSDPAIDRIVEAFFVTLKTGDAAKAYQDLWRGTVMERKQLDVDNLAAQTKSALGLYGPVLDWEVVSQEVLAPSFRKHTYLVRTNIVPLFFRFQVYRGPGGWMVQRLDFADQLERLP